MHSPATGTHHAEDGKPRGRKVTRLPVLQGVLPVRSGELAADALAGLTLAALAIPEVMGYTRIAGTPVVTGLYTILLPIALFAVFGSSRHLVVGADSATAAILASALLAFAAPGSAQWVALASLLAWLTAAVLAVARIARLGFLADFLSRTVLTGFLTGVGIQVAAGEVPSMFGLHAEGHNVLQKLWSAGRELGQVHWPDLALAVAAIALILGGRRLSRRIPGALIAVVAAIAASWWFDLQHHGVSILGPLPGGLPRLAIPGGVLDFRLLEKLLPTAVALALVILAQSAATSRAYAWKHDETFSENTDLVGLVLANVGAGLTGTFVVNGSPTKTQMVDAAGGKSQLAQLAAAVVVLVVLLLLTGPVGYLPTSILAAIVFLIGIDLIEVRKMRAILAVRRSEFWIAIATMAAVVIVGVERALLLAMALSLLDHVRRGYRPKNNVLVPKPGGGVRLESAGQPAELAPGLLVYRFNHSMYYANAEQLSRQVIALAQAAQPRLRWFVIDMDAVEDVDFSAAATLRALSQLLQRQGARLKFMRASTGVASELQTYGLLAGKGAEDVFDDVADLESAYAKLQPAPTASA